MLGFFAILPAMQAFTQPSPAVLWRMAALADSIQGTEWKGI
jgi:hypothetical protein